MSNSVPASGSSSSALPPEWRSHSIRPLTAPIHNVFHHDSRPARQLRGGASPTPPLSYCAVATPSFILRRPKQNDSGSLCAPPPPSRDGSNATRDPDHCSLGKPSPAAHSDAAHDTLDLTNTAHFPSLHASRADPNLPTTGRTTAGSSGTGALPSHPAQIPAASSHDATDVKAFLRQQPNQETTAQGNIERLQPNHSHLVHGCDSFASRTSTNFEISEPPALSSGNCDSLPHSSSSVASSVSSSCSGSSSFAPSCCFDSSPFSCRLPPCLWSAPFFVPSLDIPLYFRTLRPSDAEQLRQLHLEWFPVVYDQHFYDAVSSGRAFALGAVLRIPSKPRGAQVLQLHAEEDGQQLRLENATLLPCDGVTEASPELATGHVHTGESPSAKLPGPPTAQPFGVSQQLPLSDIHLQAPTDVATAQIPPERETSPERLLKQHDPVGHHEPIAAHPRQCGGVHTSLEMELPTAPQRVPATSAPMLSQEGSARGSSRWGACVEFKDYLVGVVTLTRSLQVNSTPDADLVRHSRGKWTGPEGMVVPSSPESEQQALSVSNGVLARLESRGYSARSRPLMEGHLPPWGLEVEEADVSPPASELPKGVEAFFSPALCPATFRNDSAPGAARNGGDGAPRTPPSVRRKVRVPEAALGNPVASSRAPDSTAGSVLSFINKVSDKPSASSSDGGPGASPASNCASAALAVGPASAGDTSVKAGPGPLPAGAPPCSGSSDIKPSASCSVTAAGERPRRSSAGAVCGGGARAGFGSQPSRAAPVCRPGPRKYVELLDSPSEPCSDIAYMLTLGVAEGFRRRGIAGELLRRALTHLRASAVAYWGRGAASPSNLRPAPSSRTRNATADLPGGDKSRGEGGASCFHAGGDVAPPPSAVYLHVIDYNAAAMSLYERMGFVRLGHAPNYYTVGGANYGAYLYCFYLPVGFPEKLRGHAPKERRCQPWRREAATSTWPREVVPSCFSQHARNCSCSGCRAFEPQPSDAQTANEPEEIEHGAGTIPGFIRAATKTVLEAKESLLDSVSRAAKAWTAQPP
eukprot:GHVT01088555.1.p1 GENE.GHVT01088555.1~~GHVT01088555.1.p1  ORF type:complete len:1036 (+),score=193.32 GHVT01088555.1:2363-5470(+)